MGPLVSAAQRAKVEGLIQAGRDEGAQIAYGGGRPAGLDRGFFVEPTLFVDVDNSMTIAQKEFFGPVGVVIPFKDERGGGPPRQRQRVRPRRRRVGGRPGARLPDRHPHPRRSCLPQRRRRGSSPHTPFGGYKNSGLGVERGEYGLEEFLLTKSMIWSAR